MCYTKFNGTEEINGKTYHRLISFRKAGYDYDKDRQIYLFDVDENYYRHEGYLREEDGKVYLLVLAADPEDKYQINIHLTWTPESEELPYIKEKLIYDFTCKESESYLGLHIHEVADEMSYKVKFIESIEINGENHRLLNVEPEGYENIELSMVEGVGIDSEYGCLTTINFLDMPTCPCASYIFNRMLSMDGKVLYPGEDKSAQIPVSDFLGVDNITDQSKENNAHIYDMIGRCISTPAPGQLYIQGGQKLIAPKN